MEVVHCDGFLALGNGKQTKKKLQEIKVILRNNELILHNK